MSGASSSSPKIAPHAWPPSPNTSRPMPSRHPSRERGSTLFACRNAGCRGISRRFATHARMCFRTRGIFIRTYSFSFYIVQWCACLCVFRGAYANVVMCRHIPFWNHGAHMLPCFLVQSYCPVHHAGRIRTHSRFLCLLVEHSDQASPS